MNEPISIYSPWSWNYCDSYGLIACQLARHLTALGAYVNAAGHSETRVDGQPADVQAVTAQPLRAALGGLFLGWPSTFEAHAGLAQYGRRVAITMFESSELPSGWPAILNRMAAVIVPSQFCFDMFKRAGVTAPLHLVPLGISEVYQPAKRDTERTPMRCLAFLDRGKRKGGKAALHAFLRAFGDNPDYRLVLKTRRNANQVELMPVGNIELIQQDMTEQELYELYCSCDVFIGPNMGEGFGLLPREFAATGGISLATSWGGTADDIERWGWPLPYTLETADWLGQPGLEGEAVGDWAVPDVDGIATKLQHVAAYRDCYAGIAYEHASNLHDFYSWRRFAERVYAIWREARG